MGVAGVVEAPSAGSGGPAPDASASRSRPRPGDRVERLYRIGVAAAAVLCAVAGTVWALAVPLFLPADESAHVDYASRVYDGIPRAGVFIPTAEMSELGQKRVPQHVSNHPPLYYWLAAPLVRLADAQSDGSWLVLLRLAGVALSCVTVVLTAVLARLVLARQRRELQAGVAVAAAGVVAVVPSFVAASGSVQNDALQLVLAALALVLAVRGYRRGFPVPLLLTTAVVCGAGMLTRVAFAPVVVAVVLVVVLGTVQEDPGVTRRAGTGRRWWLAAVRSGVIAVVTLLAAGWFYLLNLVRYGDPTGGAAVYPLVRQRTSAASTVLEQFVDPRMWWHQIAQFGGAQAGTQPKTPVQAVVAGALLVVVLVAAAGAVRHRRVLAGLDRRTWWLLGVLLLVFLICYAELAGHVVSKGSLNNRYLLSALSFLGVAGGLLLVVGGGRRLAVLASVAVALELAGALEFTAAVARRQPGLRETGWFDAIAGSAAGTGVPAAAVLLTTLLVVAGAALVAHALVLRSLAVGRAPRRAVAPVTAV